MSVSLLLLALSSFLLTICRHNGAEILLKVALNTIIPNRPFPYNFKPATWVNDIKMIASLDIKNEHWQYVHVLSMFRSPKDY